MDLASPYSPFQRAIARALRPLLRAMLHRGVRFAPIQTVVKTLLVSEASALAKLSGQKPTHSRISILTGLQRKDVKALRVAKKESLPATAGPVPRLVATWTADPAYQNSDGNPKVLPRAAQTGGVSFEMLCRSVTRDVHPRTLLDEMVRQNLAAHDPETDEVFLLADSVVPSSDEEALLHYFGMNLGDHAEAAAANLISAPKPGPFYERAVHYNQLTPESLAELDNLARTLQSETLSKLNEEALRLQKRDNGKPEATGRFRCGAFVFFKKEDGNDD